MDVNTQKNPGRAGSDSRREGAGLPQGPVLAPHIQIACFSQIGSISTQLVDDGAQYRN